VIERVFLVGFMGAGKTTVGRLLALHLDWEFVDLDAEIERREGRSIAETFTLRGEHWFRVAETECLRQVAAPRQRVVSLGGGTYLTSENRLLVESLGLSVYLEAPLEVLMGRIRDDGTRPLARDRARLGHLLEERVGTYRLARLTVVTANRTPEEIVRKILGEMEGR